METRDQNSWGEIKAELSRYVKSSEYESFKPLLEILQGMANAEYAGQPDTVRGLLDIVRQMQERAREGADPQALTRDAAQGFFQPRMDVQGGLDQAGRDFFKNVTNYVFMTGLKEIKPKEPDPSIQIPFVLLVMDEAQAHELDTGEAFSEYPDHIYLEEFTLLRALLEEKKITKWVGCYKAAREQWQPFNNSPLSIGDLIATALESVEDCSKKLVPKFIDIQTLTSDGKRERHALKDMREKGCFVIKDLISLRHPAIQRAYRRSLLDAFPNTLVVRVAPTAEAREVVQQMISFTEQYIDLEFYKRLKVDWDGRCNDEVSDIDNLGRWIRDQANKLVPKEEKGKTGWRAEAFK